MPFRRTPGRYKVFAVICVCTVVVALCSVLYLKARPRSQPQFAVVPNDKESLYLFLPTETGGLQKKPLEVRATLSERARADILLQELRKARAIPASVRLRELAFGEDGVLYLDVSHEAVEQQPDMRGEIRIVYALVNSFIASFRDVSRVQLLVDGRPVYTFSGVVYTYGPLPFNNDVEEE